MTSRAPDTAGVGQGPHATEEPGGGRAGPAEAGQEHSERVTLPGLWHLEFEHAAGRAASRFLVGLRDDQVLRASPCPSCERILVPPRTRVLVAPFPLVVPEDPLAREKLFPLLGLVRVPDARRGIDAARAMLRIGGGGHSAVIHSHDPRTVMAYGSAVQVLRVAVNVGGSTGSAGLDTNLAPTMTIGTGFFGRSSLGENLEPRHLNVLLELELKR